MKRTALLLILLFFATSLFARNERDSLRVGQRMLFSENKGQWEPQVLYRSQLSGATLFLERDCFTFLVVHPDCRPRHPRMSQFGSYRTHAYKVHFEGSEAKRVFGEGQEDTYENYFLGKDTRRWTSNVGVYGAVTYRNLYPGIDMRVYSAEHAMKYDFMVAPHADVSAIKMRYEGADKLMLRGDNLVVRTSVLDIVELAPYAYQIVGWDTVEVPASYELRGDVVTIALGAYNADWPLVIDPYLHFSTYTGSTADNWGTTSAYDSYKNCYTAGLVFGNGYPTSVGAYDGSFNGSVDVGIFKFDTNGTHRHYATYLGGSYADMPHSMFVNAFDELVIFGTTGSGDFPVTPSAFDTSFNGGTYLRYENDQTIVYPNGSDIFISRFSADGTHLQASTYVGGTGNDGLNYESWFNSGNNSFDIIMLGNDSLYFNYGDGARGELVTDDLNNIYVGTTTRSIDFPTTANSVQSFSHGQREAVVFKIDYNLSHLMWSTYFGGQGNDAIYSIDVDTNYNLLVCGGTTSGNFPTTANAYSTTYNGGSADAFIAKISRNGSTLMSSTLFGSSAYDQSYIVRVGKQNHVFVFGQTKAPGSTLVHNALYNVPNSGQFLARFTENLDTLLWSTVFGRGDGEPNISPTAFAVDICNRVYVAGWGRKFGGYYLNGQTVQWNTFGTANMEVTPDALQSSTDGQDFYLMTMDTSANALLYGSYFGELHTNGNTGHDHVDGGTSRFDRLGTLYQSVCASCGGMNAFPTTPNAWSVNNNSPNCNNAIFRINLSDDFPVAEFVPPAVSCAPYTVEFHNTGRGTRYRWDFGDGDTSNAVNPTHTYTQPGSYRVRLIAYKPGGCSYSDTASRLLQVLGNTSYWLDTVSFCPADQVQIGVQPLMGCSYHWITGSVSDSLVANPYIDESGLYTLVIQSGNCADTALQYVRIGNTAFTLSGDTVGCTSPIHLQASTLSPMSSIVWSHSPQLSDTINRDNRMATTVLMDIDTAQWIYVHVVDMLGCEGTDSLYVHFYNIMDTLMVKRVTCPDLCDGTAIALPSGYAVPPYSYAVDGGMLADSLASSLCPGMHVYRFADSNGCSITRTFSVPNAPVPDIQLVVHHVLCHEEATGSIEVIVNDTGDYTYYWFDDGSVEPARSHLVPGTYIVKTTSVSGCEYLDTVTILENADMQVQALRLGNTCPDYCSGVAIATASGGTPPYTYQWENGETQATATALCADTVVVVATDATGCAVRDSVVITSSHSFDSVLVWANDSVVYSDQTTAVHATALGGASYSWSPAHMVENPHSPNSVTEPLQDTTTFVVTITDSLGCEHIDSVKVNCIYVNCGEPNVFIPNTFTPNGDGVNDHLCVTAEYVVEYHLYIFTRWGELVYESTDINECWDGRYKNNPCLPGVYTFRCDILCEAGHRGSFKGDITLIR